MSQNDDLAYGRYYDSERGSGDGSRGLSDTFKKFKDTYKSHSKPSGQGYNQSGAPGVSTIATDFCRISLTVSVVATELPGSESRTIRI
jgi:hypothetical protein